jgi:Caspase domain
MLRNLKKIGLFSGHPRLCVLAWSGRWGPGKARGPCHWQRFLQGRPLATTVNDAALIAQTLQAAGFDVVGARDLDDGLRQTFRDLIDRVVKAGPDAVAVVYFAGAVRGRKLSPPSRHRSCRSIKLASSGTAVVRNGGTSFEDLHHPRCRSRRTACVTLSGWWAYVGRARSQYADRLQCFAGHTGARPRRRRHRCTAATKPAVTMWLQPHCLAMTRSLTVKTWEETL